MEDLVTRLRFRAAVDLQTWKAYARVGFRTERLSPINIMEGFTLLKQLPLDGNRGNVKLEVKANFALPEPEIEYSTESHRSLVGMGEYTCQELTPVAVSFFDCLDCINCLFLIPAYLSNVFR